MPAHFSTVNDLTPQPLNQWKVALGLALITLAGLAIAGYHPYAEDAEIYLPGVEHLLNPSLFPEGREFFESHASLTFFPNLIAASVRISHLPFNYVLFIWQLASMFLLLLAAWQLSGLLFTSSRARWAGVCLLASLLTLPVAGTALYVVDQYLNPRNIAAFCTMFAIARTLQSRYLRATGWIVFGAACHPLMETYTISFCIILALVAKYARVEQNGSKIAALGLLFPLVDLFVRPTPAYNEAMKFHGSHLILNWAWYEWLGIIAPVLIFWLMGRLASRRGMRNVSVLCRALIIYDVAYLAAALVISIPAQFEALARLQPLRNLHLLYMLLIILGAGLLADYVLKNQVWRWALLFLPLCAGMFWAQRELFPEVAHIEWPWSATQNPWEQALLWIRHNTPVDAVFAIDPAYIRISGEDTFGFRALAERSRLADGYKDSGAVSMFPPLAEEWWEQYKVVKDWKNFAAGDFRQLQPKFGVTWVVLQAPDAKGLNCPYGNPGVLVCKISP